MLLSLFNFIGEMSTFFLDRDSNSIVEADTQMYNGANHRQTFIEHKVWILLRKPQKQHKLQEQNDKDNFLLDNLIGIELTTKAGWRTKKQTKQTKHSFQVRR